MKLLKIKFKWLSKEMGPFGILQKYKKVPKYIVELDEEEYFNMLKGRFSNKCRLNEELNQNN